MIANSSCRPVDVWLWPGLLMALLLFTQLLGDWGRSIFAYDRALILDGQWWRLLSGNFVHLGWYHLGLNEAGLAVLVLLCPEPLPWWVWLRRLLWLSAAVTGALLWFVPDLGRYVGLSGVVHGLFVLGLLPQLLRRDPIAAACLLYLVGKILWEMIAGVPLSDEAAIGGRVVTQSHLAGTLAALAYAAVFRTFHGDEGRRRTDAAPDHDNVSR